MIPSVQEIDNEMMKLASLRKIATGEDDGPGFGAKTKEWLGSKATAFQNSSFGKGMESYGTRMGEAIEGHGLNHVSDYHLAVGNHIANIEAAAAECAMRGDHEGLAATMAIRKNFKESLGLIRKPFAHHYGSAMASIGEFVTNHPRSALAAAVTAGAATAGGAGYKAYQHYKQASEGTPKATDEDISFLKSLSNHLASFGAHIKAKPYHYAGGAAGVAALGAGGYMYHQHNKSASIGDERAAALVQRALELRG